MRNRLSYALFSTCILAGCGSSTPPPQNNPPPQQQQQKKPEPVKEVPPPPKLLVRTIRSVDTPRVARTLVQDASKKLTEQIAAGKQFTPVSTSSTAQPEGSNDCLTEKCEWTAAKDADAKAVLHTRLVQYAEQCVLLGVLYGTESQKNQWGFARAFPCDGPGVEGAIFDLGQALFARTSSVAPGPAYAVAPVQHDLKDIAWATESFAEYLTTLFAVRGKTVVPASVVASHLEGKKDPNKACPDKKCAMTLASDSAAQLGVSTKITKKKEHCTISASIWTVATKTSSATASAEGGCSAADIATGMKTLADSLIGGAPTSDLR